MQLCGCHVPGLYGMYSNIYSTHWQHHKHSLAATGIIIYGTRGPDLRMCCRYAEDRMGWIISHVWHLAGQDIEKTCGDICQKVCSLLVGGLIIASLWQIIQAGGLPSGF